jgi:hypothetical protein
VGAAAAVVLAILVHHRAQFILMMVVEEIAVLKVRINSKSSKKSINSYA